MKRLKYLISAAILLTANTVSAQGLVAPDKPAGLPGYAGGSDVLTGVIQYYVELFLAIVGIIAVAFIVYGGFRYITSGGNDEVAESAKKTITNAIIGLVVIILSYIIVVVTMNALSGRV